MAVTDRWRFHRVDPFRDLTDIQSEINRAFNSYFGLRPQTAAERIWAPPVDIHETREDVVVTVEVPGVKEKDIHLSVTGDLLSLRGQRRAAAETQDESYHRIERWSGPFERHIQLPLPVQPDKVRATYRDGILEIRLPKIEETKPREIKIEVG